MTTATHRSTTLDRAVAWLVPPLAALLVMILFFLLDTLGQQLTGL